MLLLRRTCYVSWFRFVHFTAGWESFFGRRADRCVCVSNAMRRDLRENWDISAITLHDKPPAWNFVYVELYSSSSSSSFRSLTLDQKHDFLHRLFAEGTFTGFQNPDDHSTLFTNRTEDGKTELKQDRPLLLVSSTSWTEDEDFGILLDALVGYGKNAELTKARFVLYYTFMFSLCVGRF